MTTQVKPIVTAAPTGLGAAAVVGGGTFAALTYFWKATFVSAAGGESVGSNEATVAIAASGQATITWTAPPAGVTAVNIYRGTSTGAENHLVGTVASSVAAPATTFTDTGLAGTAQTPPAAQSFTSITRDGVNRVAKSTAYLSALTPGFAGQALAAIGSWNGAGGTGAAADDAQATAAAVGLVLQEV